MPKKSSGKGYREANFSEKYSNMLESVSKDIRSAKFDRLSGKKDGTYQEYVTKVDDISIKAAKDLVGKYSDRKLNNLSDVTAAAFVAKQIRKFGEGKAYDDWDAIKYEVINKKNTIEADEKYRKFSDDDKKQADSYASKDECRLNNQ